MRSLKAFITGWKRDIRIADLQKLLDRLIEERDALGLATIAVEHRRLEVEAEIQRLTAGITP